MKNTNLNSTISSVLTKIFAEMPSISAEKISLIKDKYLTGTDLSEPQYADKFIETLTQNLELINSTPASDKKIAILQLSYTIGHKLEKQSLKQEINKQSAINASSITNLLESQNTANDLLLVRGRSGEFDQFVSKAQIDAALVSPDKSQELLSRIDLTAKIGEPDVFNAIPSNQSVITIKPGSQATTGPLATLEAQFFLKKAQTELSFLTNQKLTLGSQIQVDIQRRKVIAEMTDQFRQKVLMQADLLEKQDNNNRYTFTFMTGQLKGQTMTLSRQQLQNYKKQQLSFSEIYRKQSEISDAQQAQDQQQILPRSQASRIQAQSNRAAINYQANQQESNAQKISAAQELIQNKPPATGKIIGTPPSFEGKIKINVPNQQRIQGIQQQLRAGKPVTGALQAKKALAARKASVQRRQEVSAKQTQPAQPSKQLSQLGNQPEAKRGLIGNVFSKASGKGPAMIGKLFAGGTIGGAGTFSILDVLDLI